MVHVGILFVLTKWTNQATSQKSVQDEKQGTE